MNVLFSGESKYATLAEACQDPIVMDKYWVCTRDLGSNPGVKLHAMIMSLVFFILTPAAIFFGHFFDMRANPKWKIIHPIIQIFSFIGMIVGWVAIMEVHEEFEGIIPEDKHPVGSRYHFPVAFATIAFYIITFAFGPITFQSRRKDVPPTKFLYFSMHFHYFTGYIGFGTGALACMLAIAGIHQRISDTDYSGKFILYFVFLIILWSVVAVFAKTISLYLRARLLPHDSIPWYKIFFAYWNPCYEGDKIGSAKEMIMGDVAKSSSVTEIAHVAIERHVEDDDDDDELKEAKFNQVIVIGAGLSGLSAAHTILEEGGRVLVLEKNPFMGGNSVKATSGINGALTKVQKKLGIPDSAEKFAEDMTLSSTRGTSKDPYPHSLALCRESAGGVEWLRNRFSLDLSKVSRLGGHSYPRTHRGSERFPGMMITFTLMDKLSEVSRKYPDRCKIITKAKVVRLLPEANDTVNGVEYEKDGMRYTEFGPVVIATGGFGAGVLKPGGTVLHQVRPDLANLPTTNGEFSTGDGIVMSSEVGGHSVSMDAVQVHPTGLINPEEPENRVKFLAAEALRGEGGLILNRKGERFCNELGTRDYVVQEMKNQNDNKFWLILNSKGANTIRWHIQHYVGRNLMKQVRGVGDLAEYLSVQMNTMVPVENLTQTFGEYNEAARSGGPDDFGKRFFTHAPFNFDDTFYVAMVCPVVHYCMGGIDIDTEARVKKEDGSIINGLFACGETTGGVHGMNRLGGSSLCECVVYGRIAGKSSSKLLFQSGFKWHKLPTEDLKSIESKGTVVSSTGQPLKYHSDSQDFQITALDFDKNSSRINLEIKWQKPISPEELARQYGHELKPYTLEEVSVHNSIGDMWTVINGKVIDLTDFCYEHPGGMQPLVLWAGKDSSKEWNSVHMPDTVEKYAPQTVIGWLIGED